MQIFQIVSHIFIHYKRKNWKIMPIEFCLECECHKFIEEES